MAFRAGATDNTMAQLYDRCLYSGGAAIAAAATSLSDAAATPTDAAASISL